MKNMLRAMCALATSVVGFGGSAKPPPLPESRPFDPSERVPKDRTPYKHHRLTFPVKRRLYSVEKEINRAQIARCAINRARRQPFFDRLEDAAVTASHRVFPHSHLITPTGRKP